MLNRRSFLGRGAAALVGAGLIGTALDGRAFAASANTSNALAMKIVNHTYRYTNAQIWYYIVGTDLSTGRQAYVAPDGTLTPVSLSINGPSGYADLSIALAGDGDTDFTLPANMSGRIYFSIVDKLQFRAVADGNGNPALQYPAGWVTSDVNYPVLHDFFEFTNNGGGMNCDTTMVDQFAIPLAITLQGAQTQSAGRLVSGGRDNIFSAIAAQPDFAGLIVQNNLRIIAPGHGIDSGIFSSGYFDSYIDAVWNQYASSTLTVTTNTGSFTGQVSNGQFVFSGGVAPFNKPSTLDVFYCNGALSAPNDGLTGPVAAVLGAGFNRSTLLSDSSQPDTDPGTFYQVAPTNYYAKAMHDNMADGKAYGFPFDDVGGFSSDISDGAPTLCTLELTPF
ncbi:MAG TPA: beta-1,3-glucanase family protein [Pseudonocardiaceae bacterium]|nr:beta-1,3-glucanase family protein [Pseudonocardiaceae bacterium]